MCNAAAHRLCRTTRILIPARAQAELFPSAPHQQTGRPARLGAPTMAGAIPHVSSATMSRQTSAPMPLGLSDTSALHQRGDNGQPGSSCPAVPLPTQHRDRRRAPHQAGAIPRALRTGGSSARCAPSPFAGVPRGSGCGFTYFEVLLSIFIGLGQIHPHPPPVQLGERLISTGRSPSQRIQTHQLVATALRDKKRAAAPSHSAFRLRRAEPASVGSL